MTTQASTPGIATPRRGVRATAIAAVAGAVAAAAVFGLSRASGAELAVTSPGFDGTGQVGGITLPMAIAVALAGGVAAGIAAWAATRMSRPRATFLIVSSLVLLASISGPIQAAQEGSTAAWLIIMHFAVAAAVLTVLAPTLPTRRLQDPEVRRAN